MKATLPTLCALLFAACSCSSDDSSDRSGEGNRKNVLLISLDSTRRDFLSMYGHEARFAPGVPTTPVLERLAAEGAVMEDAYATTSWTLPSHMTLMTGEPELVHAVDIDYHEPDPYRLTLAAVLREYGYRTSGFFSGTYLEPHFGFGRGFERYVAKYGNAVVDASRRRDAADERVRQAYDAGDTERFLAAENERAEIGRELETLSHEDVSSEAVTDAALEEITAAVGDERPFFLFLHYFDPHYDYVPPTPHDRTFDPGYAGQIDGRDFIRNESIATFDGSRPDGRVRVVSERDLAHVFALYEGELAWTDSEIGRVLQRLDELGVADDTLVIVTADHGDEFFEHGYLGHRINLFEESTQIPMLVRFPGYVPAGRRIDGLVSNMDVTATVLDLLELDPIVEFSSRSFADLLRGRADGGSRSVIGRIVNTHSLRPNIPGAPPDVAGQLVVITESWHQGAIKILRKCSWTRYRGTLSPALKKRLDAQSEAMKAREELLWIDLARFPREPAQAWSSDFSDPRAHAALQAFHDRYAELLQKRDHADIREDGGRFMEVLRGIGYADGDTDVDAQLSSDEFVLPPPGRALLR